LKIDIGNDTQEKRKKHYITPTLYLLAEISLAWLILSLVMLNFNVTQWSMWGKIALLLATGYSTAKTIKIYRRQKNYKRD